MSADETIYVIDDDPALRESLEFLLGTSGFSVSTFDSALKFLQALPTRRGGCIVSDVRMPDIDGIELLRRIKAAGSTLPVIVMTGHGDIALAVEAMKLGATDFIEKPFDDSRLIAAIKSALDRSASQSGSWPEMDDLSKRVKSLSERERQVMEGILAGHSNKMIARDYDISPRTVEVYRAHVMAKMNAQNLPDLIRLAFRAGIFAA